MALKFRERAKEKLNAAEDFDAPVSRIVPHWWLAVCGSLLSIAAFAVWAVWGEVPQTAEGNGVYLQETGDVFCFVQIEERAGIEEKMKVSFQELGGTKAAVTGYIEEEKGLLNSQEDMLAYVGGSDMLLEYFTQGKPSAVYRCVLEDQDGMKDGTVFSASIQKAKIHPIELWMQRNRV